MAVRFPPSQIQAPSFAWHPNRIGVARLAHLALRLSVKLSILDTRRRKRVTAVHLLRHRPSWYPSLETAPSQTQTDPLIVVYAGVTKKQLDEVMLTLDKNGDGEIKFDEFAEW